MDIKHLINEPSAERDASSRTDEPYRTPRPSVATTSRQPAIFVDPNPGLHLRSPLLEGMECLGRGGDGWESAVGLCHGWIRDVLLTIADGRLEDARVALFAGCDFVEAHIVEIGMRSYTECVRELTHYRSRCVCTPRNTAATETVLVGIQRGLVDRARDAAGRNHTGPRCVSTAVMASVAESDGGSDHRAL